MTPTEKHRETATQVFADADFVETVPEAVEIIARALAIAEREGMKRAAEIALARTHKSIAEIAPVGSDAYWQGSASSAECIRNAILSEAGEA